MDHDQDQQWTVGRLRAALEHVPADTPLSVCLPQPDGTLVFAPLVDAGHDAQLVADLPGLEFPLYGAGEDTATEARLNLLAEHVASDAFTLGPDVVVHATDPDDEHPGRDLLAAYLTPRSSTRRCSVPATRAQLIPPTRS